MTTARVKGFPIDSHKFIKMLMGATKCVEMIKGSGDESQKPILMLLFSGKRFCHGRKLIPLQTNLGKRKCVHLRYTYFSRMLFPYVFFS